VVVLAVNQDPVAFVPDRRSRMPRATHCEITELRNAGVVALAPAGIVVVSTEESGSLTRCSDQKSPRLWSCLSELLAVGPHSSPCHGCDRAAWQSRGSQGAIYLAPRDQGSAAAAGRADRGPFARRTPGGSGLYSILSRRRRHVLRETRCHRHGWPCATSL
jgi:hypothetical protein